jgi:hypothetical protein
MTASSDRADTGLWNVWRIARWTAVLGLLLLPLVMMQFNDEWNWTVGDFLFAGTMIGGVALLYELAERASGSRAYRAGAAVVLITCLLTVWTTIVRDDGNGMLFFELVMAAVAGSFAAWFRPAGMARSMIGVAVMQMLVGIAVATAPSAAGFPGGASRALLFSGFFALLWLVSAAFFRAAARSESVPA